MRLEARADGSDRVRNRPKIAASSSNQREVIHGSRRIRSRRWLLGPAERLIAGLINNSALAPVVALTGLTEAHFPPGMGLRNSFRFAMAGRDCVKAHVASKYEDLSRQVLRRLASLRVELTVAETKAF